MRSQIPFFQSRPGYSNEYRCPVNLHLPDTGLFTIEELETIKDATHLKANLIKHLSNHKIIWIKKGTGKLLIDFEKYVIEDNTVYFLEPGELYIFSQRCDITGYLLSFPTSLINQTSGYSILHAGLSNDDANCFSPSHNCNSDEELEAILDMVRDNKKASTGIIACLLEILLLYLKRNCKIHFSKAGTTNCTGLARVFNKLVCENMSIKKKVSYYAGEMAVSPGYLNAVIKDSFGKTASSYIQRTILLEAMRQCIYFGRTIKDISESLGFEDISYFSKCFKRNFGVTCREFKSNIQLYMGQVKTYAGKEAPQKKWSLL